MFSAGAYFRLRRRDLRMAPGAIFLVALLALATFLNIYGDRVMKRALQVSAILALGLLVSACATTDLTKLVDAANELDPDCAKYVEVEVRPLLLFGWPIPIPEGRYIKACKAEELPRSPVGLTVGAAVGTK